MARFLQEHLAPQAHEIDHSNEFKNLRVSHEAPRGTVWELGWELHCYLEGVTVFW